MTCGCSDYKNIKKVLIIKTSSLGDIIHVLPCIKAIRELFPSAKISWLVQKEYAGLLEGNPYIDECVTVERLSLRHPSSFKKVLDVLAGLRNENFDIVIDFQWLVRTGIIAFLTGAPLRFGLKNWKEPSHLFYNRKVFVEHENIHAVERNILFTKAICAQINEIIFPLHLDETSKDTIKKLLGCENKYVVIAPSTRWATKKWPAGSFSSLIGKIPLLCVIIGGKGDRETAQEIIGLVKHEGMNKPSTSPLDNGGTRNVIDLCGKTNLRELIALVSGAKAVVSNDSGPMHIAAALDKPVVALFGPTDPVRTGPYGWQKNMNLKVITSEVPCGPCFRRKCRELTCMKNISAETVFEALREYL